MAVSAEIVITTLTIAGGLALGVERSLEMIKHLLNIANRRLQNTIPKNAITTAQEALRNAEKHLEQETQRLVEVEANYSARSATVASATINQQLSKNFIATDAPQTDASIADAGAPERYFPPPIQIIQQTRLSPVTCTNALFYQLVAASLGIFLVEYFNLHLLALLLSENGIPEIAPQSFQGVVFYIADMIFSGLVIGGGSQPIHLVLRFITERKLPVTNDEQADEVIQEKALSETLAKGAMLREQKEERPFQWIDIPYRGGVNPETLERVHIRPSNPNLIVYHHTAMSSSTSFQDIVDEFLVTKKWLTGYNCVIMPDGAIKWFCRLDRYGNHAKGRNARSLGISFHGNFHTGAGDKYSNADGRYGNQQPTEAQLHAGARVVALWVALYKDIALDFERCIKPHKEVMPSGYTVCPGSGFKYKEFESLIEKYHAAWSHSDEAQEGIAQFKQLKYVYAVEEV